MNDARVFAVMVCSYLAFQTLASWRWQLAYFRVSRGIERPPRLLSVWRLPALGEGAFLVSGVLLVAGCALGASGWRAGFWLALAAALAYFSQILLLDSIQRKISLLPQLLLIFAVSPASVAPWHSAGDPWPLAMATTAVAAVFVAAGLTKLWRSGWRWADGRALQAYLLTADLRYDVPRARRLASRRGLCATLSGVVLAYELFGWLVLILPGGGYAFAAFGLALHAGNLALLRINYFKYFLPAYFVFAAHPVATALGAFVARA